MGSGCCCCSSNSVIDVSADSSAPVMDELSGKWRGKISSYNFWFGDNNYMRTKEDVDRVRFNYSKSQIYAGINKMHFTCATTTITLDRYAICRNVVFDEDYKIGGKALTSRVVYSSLYKDLFNGNFLICGEGGSVMYIGIHFIEECICTNFTMIDKDLASKYFGDVVVVESDKCFVNENAERVLLTVETE